jgi:hypothetical protein
MQARLSRKGAGRGGAARDTGSVPEVIYVELLDEGVDVWAPVEAEPSPDGSFVLPESAPDDETWAFPPGARVICERRGADLLATALASEDLLACCPAGLRRFGDGAELHRV